MEIRQVQYALAVANFGSYSSAAEELFISQSSLSKQIIALEHELGFPIFDRTHRKIALTPSGETFLNHAEKIDAAYRAMLADLRECKISPALSIVAIPVIAQYGITSLVAMFRSRYPEVALTLEEREAGAILPLLNNHQYDLAFVRDNFLDPAAYCLHQIAADRLQVVVSRRHRYANQPHLSLHEIADENFILFDKGTVVHELAVDACRATGFEPRIFYASLRVESILGMVASNVGITLMMEKVAAYHQHPDVVIIPLREEVQSRIVLIAPRSRPLGRTAKSFMDFMEKILAPA